MNEHVEKIQRFLYLCIRAWNTTFLPINSCMLGVHRVFRQRVGKKVYSGALYLTKTYGIVVGLGSCVEVDGLFDIIMALIVSGQVV